MEFGVLRISYMPISNAKHVLDRDGEIFLGIEGVCVGIILETVPLIVDELNRFKGIGCGDMLGNVISVVVSVPLDGPFYVFG
jgi:hypothetical protein